MSTCCVLVHHCLQIGVLFLVRLEHVLCTRDKWVYRPPLNEALRASRSCVVAAVAAVGHCRRRVLEHLCRFSGVRGPNTFWQDSHRAARYAVAAVIARGRARLVALLFVRVPGGVLRQK